MATEILSQQQLYDLIKNEIQNRDPNATDFSDGSEYDSLAGGFSVGLQEVQRIMLDLFAKTYINTANGPEVTGGPDDLQSLLTDHFGDSFARPDGSAATGVVSFSRPTSAAGNITIPAGTIVKTEKDANGEEQRFETESEVILSGLTIDASVAAVENGAAGNVNSGTITVIESVLGDPTITVTNAAGFVGGDDEFDDSEYREFARNKIETIRGATGAAIEAAALNVAGVEVATVIENILTVINWDIGTSMPVGDPFKIPEGVLYVADANGTASQALLDDVEEAVFAVKACGVIKRIEAAVPLSIDWSSRYTLNPGGPNFATLSTDPTLIEESMTQYIQQLPIGTDFNRSLARQAILDTWGPTGTNDLTDFITDVPVGNISAQINEKLIPGTIESGL